MRGESEEDFSEKKKLQNFTPKALFRYYFLYACIKVKQEIAKLIYIPEAVFYHIYIQMYTCMHAICGAFLG